MFDRLTLQPPDLRGWSISLFVSSCDSEDDGGLGGEVYVCGRQTGRGDHARGVRAAVHAHKRQLGWGARLLLRGRGVPHRQVHGVLGDLTGSVLWRLP